MAEAGEPAPTTSQSWRISFARTAPVTGGRRRREARQAVEASGATERRACPRLLSAVARFRTAWRQRMRSERFDAKPALAQLKSFQRRTVDYVFDRLHGPDQVRHFLVADEVGLGKTMVARGVIAKTIERLWDDAKRIDILYICSNRRSRSRTSIVV